MLTKNLIPLFSLPKLLAFLFVFMLFALPNSNAQKAKGNKVKGVLNRELKERKAHNVASIEALKETGLIFYIPTKTKKIEAIQKVMGYSSTSEKAHERLAKQQKKLIKLNQIKTKAFLDAFSNDFDFCPIYITYDTCASKIKKKETGWFLNSSGEFDPSIVTNTEVRHWVVISNTPGSTTSSYESLVLKQAADPQLEYPFPYFAVFRKAFNIRKLRRQGLANDLQDKPASVESKTVHIWNSRLKRYYNSRSLE